MKLREVASIQSGMTVKSRLQPDWSSGIKVIRLQDVGFGGIAVESLRKHRVPEVSDRYVVAGGDVVFRSRGMRTTATYVPYSLSEVVVAVMPVLILRPIHSIISPKYLAWEINKSSSQQQLKRVARNSSISMIPRAELENLDIDVPDIETQNLVADTDELIERSDQVRRELTEHQITLDKYRLSLTLHSSA